MPSPTAISPVGLEAAARAIYATSGGILPFDAELGKSWDEASDRGFMAKYKENWRAKVRVAVTAYLEAVEKER